MFYYFLGIPSIISLHGTNCVNSISFIGNKRPQVTDLMQIFTPFSDHWYEIGLSLFVSNSTLQWIQQKAMTSSMKLKLVLQEWEKIDNSPITWQIIIDTISYEPINKPSLRHEIEIMAEKCK